MKIEFGKLRTQARTAPDMRDEIVSYLKSQASHYSTTARLAERKRVKALNNEIAAALMAVAVNLSTLVFKD